MHIAIDISPLESGHKLRGIGYYTSYLIGALKKYKSEHSYSFFTRGQKVPKGADLVHFPYFDPFFLTLPITKSKPTVVTVHDLIPIAYASHFPTGLWGSLKWQIQRFSLRGASAILTDSQASKKDIVRLTGFPQQKIHTVYLAPSAQYTKVTAKQTLTRVRKAYCLPPRYILYVGDVNWNKNIPGLLNSFAKLRQKDKDIELVFVGKPFLNDDISETRAINVLIKELSLTDYIHKLGYVKDEDLAAIYTLASVYVQPSFAEGFGFPILEAMACGCPVVCSRETSLSEISGPARRVDPHNVDDIVSGIWENLHLEISKRRSLELNSLSWVKQFSWKNVANETCGVYERALD